MIAADITVQHLMTYLFNAAIKIISKLSAWIILDDEGLVLYSRGHLLLQYKKKNIHVLIEKAKLVDYLSHNYAHFKIPFIDENL